MADIRAHICAGTFLAFLAEQRERLGRADPDHPPGRPPRKKPRKPERRGDFALHTSPHGYVSVQHVPSGEIMHSVNDPDVEAARIYVEQSQPLARSLAGSPGATGGASLVVWDVGLGAGHNAMALVRAIDRTRGRADACAPIELVSFERDLDAFRLVLAHVEHFPHLRHRAPHVLAHRSSYQQDGLSWSLCEGDFLATFATQPQPDIIFYDPFSAKVDAAMWSLAAFTRLFAYLIIPTRPTRPVRPVELFTYTSSTAIRSAMLAAGFHVAHGVASGPKTETTIALTHPVPPYALLGREWLDKRQRSAARFPMDVPFEQRRALDEMILGHAQFARPPVSLRP